MNIALIGYGIENQAAYRYFADKGAQVTICDQDASLDLPNGAQSQLGDNYLNDLGRFELIVRTSGMHPSIITAANPGTESKITTAVNIFFKECTVPIIGVTGTKGKGTTTTLIHRILEAAGKKSIIAGNIGVPVLDMLEQAQNCDFVALELSSFQLYDLKHSPHIGVCLMVVPEHLNWHTDFADYTGSKTNLFVHQKSDDVAIYNALNAASQEIAATSPAQQKISYGVPSGHEDTFGCSAYVKDGAIFYNGTMVMKTTAVKLLGRHNLENVCAAIAATWDITNGNVAAIREAIMNFSGLPYRLEFIREVNGVKYYNDSFSTTPETAIAALRSFEQPVVIILGGSDKGVEFNQLADEVASKPAKQALIIGETGASIAALLRSRGFTAITDSALNTMSEIVLKSSQLAEPGDVVLLSTGSASFDMFKDYKDRGDKFNQAVASL